MHSDNEEAIDNIMIQREYTTLYNLKHCYLWNQEELYDCEEKDTEYVELKLFYVIILSLLGDPFEDIGFKYLLNV